MSSPFYVWDPVQHAGFPASLTQAEYSAIHAPRESATSAAVIAWIEAVKAFVLSDDNKPYMSGHVIHAVNELYPHTVLEIEVMHIEGGDYFYKFLMESIRSHHLAAYDSYRGIFICNEYLLPEQAGQQFADVVHPSLETMDINQLPKSEKQFIDLVFDWFSQQQFGCGKFEKREFINPKFGRYYQLIRESDLFIEECSLFLTYRGQPKVSDFCHRITVKPLIDITSLSNFRMSPESLKYMGEVICHYNLYLDNVIMLKDFLNQIKHYFDMIDPYMRSLSTLNHLLNHNDDFNIKNDYFGYKKARGYQPLLLAISKLVNDPAYPMMYAQWESNVKADKGEAKFHTDLEGQYAYLSQIQPIENL